MHRVSKKTAYVRYAPHVCVSVCSLAKKTWRIISMAEVKPDEGGIIVRSFVTFWNLFFSLILFYIFFFLPLLTSHRRRYLFSLACLRFGPSVIVSVIFYFRESRKHVGGEKKIVQKSLERRDPWRKRWRSKKNKDGGFLGIINTKHTQAPKKHSKRWCWWRNEGTGILFIQKRFVMDIRGGISILKLAK